MPAPTLDFKIAFLEGLLSQFGERPIRILDMGCGRAKDWPGVLRSRPWVTYVGVEPDLKSRSVANELPHGLPANVLAGWGEAMNAPESFDLTVSLSVLEHVKYLDPFLRASVAATPPSALSCIDTIWATLSIPPPSVGACWSSSAVVCLGSFRRHGSRAISTRRA